MKLFLNPNIIEKIVSNIQKKTPKEFCAFLHGKVTDDEIIINEIHPIKNYAKSGRFFVLKKEDVLKSKNHIAFFHSHNRGNLELSRLDKKNYHFIANCWVLGKISNKNLLLKAYNSDYEDINIKRQSQIL